MSMTPALRTAILDALLMQWPEEEHPIWLKLDEPISRKYIESIIDMILPVAEPMIRKAALREAAEAFEPCRSDYQVSGIIQWTWRDTPYVAKPVVPGVHHFLDDLVAMDDGKVIGVQFWGATDAHLALGEPK